MRSEANKFKNGGGYKSGNVLAIFFAYYIAIFIPQILPIPTALSTPYKAVVLLIFLGYFLINYVNSKIPFEPLILAIIILITQIISFCYSLEFMDFNKYFNDNINIFILPVYIFVFYGILADTGVDKYDICKFFKRFIIFMIIACIYNIITNIKIIMNFFNITDAYQYNLQSFFDNRNTFAAYLVYGIIGCIYVSKIKNKRYIYFSLVLFCANLIFALSRTAIVSLTTFLLVYFWVSSEKNKILKLGILGVLICAIVVTLSVGPVGNFVYDVLFRVKNGTTGRYGLWILSLNFYKSHNIFFGTGYGVVSSYLEIATSLKSAHNVYINILVTGGITLCIFYLSLLVYTIRINLRIVKEDRIMGAFFTGIMICYLVSSLSEANVLLTSSGLSFLISGFVLVLPKLYYNLLNQNKLNKIT